MASGYKRILLKVSGEALAGDNSFGIEPPFLQGVARQIADVARTGTQVAIVVGGGNIFRGMAGAADGTDRVTADLMGMLGTMINALALSNAISRQGVKSKPFSAATMPSVADTFTARDAKLALEEGFVVVLGGGTGNPFFTTDTAATLRAIELECDVVLKGTKVDGVYSDDPKKNPDAVRYAHISFDDVISQNLKVMDTAAFALARDNRMPIIVYALDVAEGLSGVLEGRGRSTLVGDHG
ncbi:uridylate kinase [Devosia soli]|uniref:Uridylate kinase n=1 Tax=Devosia soli TaxID=361041 RepID=A0A0F5L744_9HYPH|nr:UMP kinase [Devosia soli]KKB78045.1 uridylate kinase [Devosia soli]